MIPVCGFEGEGIEHFRRFCRFEWPSYEVIFTVLDPTDPALPLLREVQSTSNCKVKLQIEGHSEGANLKVRNLLNAFPLVAYDWIVVCDADVKPEPNFLDGLIFPFGKSNPKKDEIGMVHSLYRCMNDKTIASSWENVWINCDFWAQGLLGDWLKGTDFAFGAAMAFHRSTLNQIGGFAAIRDYLADDYQLGNRISKLGKRLVFNSDFVTLQAKAQTWDETWCHLMRWSRTIRVSQPAGYAGSIVMNVMLMALLGFWVDFLAFFFWSSLALILRIIMAHQCRNWILEKRGFWSRWWLILFKDLAQIALWLLAFRNSTVEWRGIRYALNSDGKLIEERVIMGKKGK